jgi:hypothetical protein
MSIHRSGELLRELRKRPENCYIIHYSCQSLYDDNEALSPRVTSIAVSHFSTEQTVSFSTHSIAEELGIAREDVIEKFDDIERKLLSDFYAFVRDRRDRHWLHWNMRNLTYGFEHLEHRYRVLGCTDASVIPVERRINLSDLMTDRYGSDYAPHPKQKSLMELNGGVHRHFLTGEEEVQAFQNHEFIRMHNSTLAKVGFMLSVLKKIMSGKLRTASRGVGVALDRMFEHRWVKVIGVLGAVITIGVGAWQIWLWTVVA